MSHTEQGSATSADLAALHRPNRELLEFLEEVPVALHWMDLDGLLLWANRTELALLGYDERDYLGRRISEFLVDPAVADDILERLRRGETLTAYPLRLRRQDGSVKDVDLSCNLHSEGETGRVRCAMTDVSDRREAEETRALLAAIVSTSEDAILSKSLEGIIRSWNDAAERMFGYTAAEAVGRPMTLLFPPELEVEEQGILDKIRRGERVKPFETVRVAKDGRRRDVSVAVSPVRDASGRIVGASTIARDITERKQADEKLRASEERFRAIVESQSEVTCRFRRDGTLLFVNGAYARVLGTTSDEAVTGNFWDHIAEADRPGVREKLQRLAPGHPEMRTECRIVTSSGERWVLWTSRALAFDVDGHVLEIQSAGIDITERKRAEEALLAADRRKDEFLATLGHELRNPLAPIRNTLELLRHPEGPPPGERRAHYDMMARQLDVIVRLVDDILDVSRITEGKLQLRKERVELGSVVRRAVDEARRTIDEAGHELLVTLPEEPVIFEADPVRLTQVLTNLLSNAASYTPEGGRIELDAALEGCDVRIGLRDNGIGIPAGKLDTIFEMFSQPNAAAAPARSGLGIGLSLVKWIVELHGGRIDAHSDGPGCGSEFTVRLPLGRMAGAVPSRADARGASAGQRYRVLIVDDNEDAASTLAMLVETLGHTVRAAYDGGTAFDATAEFAPDVMLLDIGLPDVSGYDLARQIRRQRWGESVLIVAVTGWGQEADRQLAFEAGCDDHVRKPVTLSALRSLLESVGSTREANQPPT